MDWDFAIERNRGLLLGAVAGLFARVGLADGVTVERLSRPLYRKVLALLKPAEAAVRRLIIVMARDIVVKPSPRRPAPARAVPPSKRRNTGNSKEERKARRPTFNLFDPQKCSDAGKRRRRRRPRIEPRVHVLDYDARIPEPFRSLFAPAPAAPAPAPQPVERITDRTVNARSLCRRLFAIRIALEDLSRQAKRYARWGARPVEERRPRRERALRFGWPPGWRVKPTHDVHEILKDCHWLVGCLPIVDTS